MQLSDLVKLFGLSSIWGASFLFMRVAAPSFGPIPLMLVRVATALLCFLPFFFRPKVRQGLRTHAKHLAVTGLLSTAVPFCLIAFATLSLEAGFTSLINATTPLFAAAVGAVWLGIPLKRIQILGLFIGVVGVLILVWGRLSFTSGGAGWAIAAGLLATFSYGVSVHYARRFLTDVSALVCSAGSMLSGSIALLPLGLALWPEVNPSLLEWGCGVSLGVFCTALAYVIFFDVIGRTGATNASTVTFMVPGFAILWGALFLGETLTPRVVAGMLVTLAGTAFTVGFVPRFLERRVKAL
ncbi:DMT family transporter [Pelagicoccus sp. SDUM812002]|uniref:DMT family transporter n=1 Tax=Pelagicoccus sp. SDUM812002 TaxID=3041266 RepID=UPI00280CAD13|nr:DMT family transporter [Pelagicoccus sp. SDUM812002]MDQ8184750.1 DMT family transporter [Pelagicoccus sp. SDUM812002]